MPWAVFLKAHWKAAADFFSVEVWSWRGLMTHYVLFVVELATRRVRIAGLTVQPDAGWMMQMGRNLVDVFDGPLLGKQYLRGEVVSRAPAQSIPWPLGIEDQSNVCCPRRRTHAPDPLQT